MSIFKKKVKCNSRTKCLFLEEKRRVMKETLEHLGNITEIVKQKKQVA